MTGKLKSLFILTSVTLAIAACSGPQKSTEHAASQPQKVTLTVDEAHSYNCSELGEFKAGDKTRRHSCVIAIESSIKKGYYLTGSLKLQASGQNFSLTAGGFGAPRAKNWNQRKNTPPIEISDTLNIVHGKDDCENGEEISPLLGILNIYVYSKTDTLKAGYINIESFDAGGLSLVSCQSPQDQKTNVDQPTDGDLDSTPNEVPKDFEDGISCPDEATISTIKSRWDDVYPNAERRACKIINPEERTNSGDTEVGQRQG